MALGCIGGGDVNCVKSFRALPCVSAGSCAGIHGDAGECRLQFLKGAGENRDGWPTKCVDFKIGVECAGFGVKLGQNDANGPLRLV